ncbi:unnamed protein product [Urochloa decumbens]|uniref:Uncharacterized protein n=1 Tax=Urochloa decumbens TaxID=240449 RepID=A0ABC8YGD3_9POAL
MGSEVDAPVTRAFSEVERHLVLSTPSPPFRPPDLSKSSDLWPSVHSWDPGQWRGEAVVTGVDNGSAGERCRRPVMRTGKEVAMARSGGEAT